MRPDRTNSGFVTSVVAKREGVDVRTVESWCDEGRVPAWKTPGGQWRIARNYRACIGDEESST